MHCLPFRHRLFPNSALHYNQEFWFAIVKERSDVCQTLIAKSARHVAPRGKKYDFLGRHKMDINESYSVFAVMCCQEIYHSKRGYACRYCLKDNALETSFYLSFCSFLHEPSFFHAHLGRRMSDDVEQARSRNTWYSSSGRKSNHGFDGHLPLRACHRQLS